MLNDEILEKTHPAFEFIKDEDGVTDIGEDFAFAIKAREAGFEVWCDFDVVCDHHRLARFAPLAYRLQLEQQGNLEVCFEEKK